MTHPDLDELLNALLPFAQQMLSKRGEFFPFGATMKPDGEFAFVMAHDDDERPPTQQILDNLIAGLRDQAAKGEVRAVGVCVNMTVTPPGTSDTTDAICALLDHSAGDSVEVYLPYKKGMFGRFKYGDVFAGPGDAAIFQNKPTDEDD